MICRSNSSRKQSVTRSKVRESQQPQQKSSKTTNIVLDNQHHNSIHKWNQSNISQAHLISELNLAQKIPLEYIQGSTMSLSPEYFPEGSMFQNQGQELTNTPSAARIQQKRLKRGSRSVDRSRKNAQLNNLIISQSPPQEKAPIVQALHTLQKKQQQFQREGQQDFIRESLQTLTQNDLSNQPNKRYVSQNDMNMAQHLLQMTISEKQSQPENKNAMYHQQSVSSPQPLRMRFPLTSTTVDSNQNPMGCGDQQTKVAQFDLSGGSPNRFTRGLQDLEKGVSKNQRESDKMRSELLRLLQQATTSPQTLVPSSTKVGSQQRKNTSSFGQQGTKNAFEQSQNVIQQKSSRLHQLPSEILLSYPSARHTASTASIPPLDLKSLNPSQKTYRRSQKSTTTSRKPKSQSSSHGPRQKRGHRAGEYTSRTRQKSKISQKQRATNDLLMNIYGWQTQFATNAGGSIATNTQSQMQSQNAHETHSQKTHTKNSHSVSDFGTITQNQATNNFIYETLPQQKVGREDNKMIESDLFKTQNMKSNPISPKLKPKEIQFRPILASAYHKKPRKACSHKRLLVNSGKHENVTMTNEVLQKDENVDYKTKTSQVSNKRTSQGKKTRKNELAVFLNKVLSQNRNQSDVQNAKSLKSLLQNKDFGSVQEKNNNRRQGSNLFSKGFLVQNSQQDHLFGIQNVQKPQKNKMVVLLQDHSRKDFSKGIDEKFVKKLKDQERQPHFQQNQKSTILRTVNPGTSTATNRTEDVNQQFQTKHTPSSQSLICLQQQQENERQLARLLKSIQQNGSQQTTSPRERTIIGGETVISSEKSKNTPQITQTQKPETPLILSSGQQMQNQREIVSEFTRQIQNSDPACLKLHKTTSQKFLKKPKESFTSGESQIVNIQVTKSSEGDRRSENGRVNEQKRPPIFARPSDSTPEIDLARSPIVESNLVVSERLDSRCPETHIEKEVSKRSVMVQVDLSANNNYQNYQKERLSTHRRSSDFSNHRENKDSDIFAKKQSDDLLKNRFEKQGLELVQDFVEDQLRSFLENLAKDDADCSQLLSLLMKKTEKKMSLEQRQNSQVLNTCFVLITALTQSSIDMLHRRDDEIALMEQNLEQVVKAGEKTLTESKKRQREAYVATEKLSLAESMSKLKDKEVSNLKKKVEQVQNHYRQKVQSWKEYLEQKDDEIQRNNIKFGRELKALYEQNKDLFAHNRALRDDLQDQDEKVRKLGNIVRRHPNIIRNLEAELDQTEPRCHESSTISNAIPIGNSRQYDNQTPKRGAQNLATKAKECIEVGPNKIKIPVFDQKIIDKYNKLNIEGKLPHIVESNHFNAEAVKEEVKLMLAKGLLNDDDDRSQQWEEVVEESSCENEMPICAAEVEAVTDDGQKNGYDQNLFDSPAGKGPMLPRVAEMANLEVMKGYQEAALLFDENNFKDSWNDKSGKNLLTKIPSVNSPNHFFENMDQYQRQQHQYMMMTPGQQLCQENEIKSSDARLMELAEDIGGNLKNLEMIDLITPTKKQLLDSLKQQSEEIDNVLNCQKQAIVLNSNDGQSSFENEPIQKGKKNFEHILQRESMEQFQVNLNDQIEQAAALNDQWVTAANQDYFVNPVSLSSQFTSSLQHNRKQTRQIQRDEGHFFQEQQQLWLTQKHLIGEDTSKSETDKDASGSEVQAIQQPNSTTSEALLQKLDKIAYQQVSSGESNDNDFLQMDGSSLSRQFVNLQPTETLQEQISKHYSPIMRVRADEDKTQNDDDFVAEDYTVEEEEKERQSEELRHNFNMYERNETTGDELPTNSMSLPASDTF